MADVPSNWPFENIGLEEDEAVYDLLKAGEGQLDRIDVQLDELQEQRLLDTATSRELEKLAGEVGVLRQTGESDERLRFRALIGKAVTRSDGTVPDIAQLLVVLFGEEATQRVSISAAADTPTVQIEIPSDVLDDCPLTRSELENELGPIVPASDDLTVLSSDTWRLGESGAQGLGEGGLV